MKSNFKVAACFTALLLFLPSFAIGETRPYTNPCGTSPSDWCESLKGDPCGSHKDRSSCEADAKCEGMPYRGESVVACQLNSRNFASNCPTVGCVLSCANMPAELCKQSADRCVLNGESCESKFKK